MTKILIVDDEELIREGIARKIERLMPHADIVGKAENAKEAMELISLNLPDIVITDIRMPEMDGLQFINEVKSKNNNIDFIIISGFDNFEYARNAIKLGVSEYLLKPVNNDELKNAISNLEKKTADKRQQNEYMKQLESKIYNSLFFLKSKYLNDLIYCDFDAKNILKSLEYVEIGFTNKFYTVITVILYNLDKLPQFHDKKEAYLAKFGVQNIAEEILSEAGKAFAFENLKKENQVVIIVNHNTPDESTLLRLCRKMQDSLSELLQLKSSIGIGKTYKDINCVHNSYIESYRAPLQSGLLGNNSVISINEISDNQPSALFLSDNDKMLLRSSISSHDTNKAIEIISCLFESFEQQHIPYYDIKTLLIDMSIMLIKIIKENGGDWNIIFKEDIFQEDFISHFTKLNEVKEWMEKCVRSVCSYLSGQEKSDGKKIINEVQGYINNYYYLDINLTELAKKYFINPSYLSQLFKSETGVKFIDYVTNVRIEKAKELSSKTSLKLYQIAEMVGYNDFRHFSATFSKYTGLTPSKFRELNNIHNIS